MRVVVSFDSMNETEKQGHTIGLMRAVSGKGMNACNIVRTKKTETSFLY